MSQMKSFLSNLDYHGGAYAFHVSHDMSHEMASKVLYDLQFDGVDHWHELVHVLDDQVSYDVSHETA